MFYAARISDDLLPARLSIAAGQTSDAHATFNGVDYFPFAVTPAHFVG